MASCCQSYEFLIKRIGRHFDINTPKETLINSFNSLTNWWILHVFKLVLVY